jgi:hypothetical protein
MRKLLFIIAIISTASFVNAQDLKSIDKFKASFMMDSAESLGGW